MHWKKSLEPQLSLLKERLTEKRLFASDAAEHAFRAGLSDEADKTASEDAISIRSVTFDGIDPVAVGRALASLRTGAPLLLASKSWGSWTWSRVRKLERLGLAPGSIVIRTGGSTGEAKFAVHTWETLATASAQLQSHLGDKPLSAVIDLPFHHVSGWMTVMRALCSGGLLSLPGENFELPGLLCRSVVPTTLFRALEDRRKLKALQRADLVFGGGAAFDKGLLDQARAGRIRLRLVYGMTETAAMIALQDGENFAKGEPPSLRPIGTNAVRVDDQGEILVRSPQLCQGYWGSEALADADGWWRTGDIGEETAEGGFRPSGRKGRYLTSGGETVSLERVEKIVAELEGVEDFWLGTMPDGEWGKRLVLFLVSRRPADWREELKRRLDPGEVPAEVRLVPRIPRGAAGKVDPDLLFD